MPLGLGMSFSTSSGGQQEVQLFNLLNRRLRSTSDTLSCLFRSIDPHLGKERKPDILLTSKWGWAKHLGTVFVVNVRQERGLAKYHVGCSKMSRMICEGPRTGLILAIGPGGTRVIRQNLGPCEEISKLDPSVPRILFES